MPNLSRRYLVTSAAALPALALAAVVPAAAFRCQLRRSRLHRRLSMLVRQQSANFTQSIGRYAAKSRPESDCKKSLWLN
jgi:hypothetical protein